MLKNKKSESSNYFTFIILNLNLLKKNQLPIINLPNFCIYAIYLGLKSLSRFSYKGWVNCFLSILEVLFSGNSKGK
jgi:hypothetical protein